MSTTVRSLSLLAALLVIPILLVGCLGGGGATVSSEKQIRDFLLEAEVALTSMNAKRVANLWYYPIIVDGEEITREDMEAVLHILFREMEIEGVVIQEVRYLVSDSDIVVDSAGKRAIIEKAKVITKITVDGEMLEETNDAGPFELIKQGATWKFYSTDWMF